MVVVQKEDRARVLRDETFALGLKETKAFS